MTDETTARDRAIERAYTVALGEITSAAISTPADTLAMRVVFALLAYPEVLRALAGAPTADVAAPPHSDPCSTCGGYGIVHDPGYYVPGEQFVEPPSDERCEDCVGTGMREVQERIRSAAPEGVDAADEPHAIRIRPAYEADGSMYDEPCTRRAGCGSGTHQLSCPEPDEPDGMDLEAEGEMADQLAAAQAAIQRVRDLCTDHAELDHSRGWTVSAGAALRARSTATPPRRRDAHDQSVGRTHGHLMGVPDRGPGARRVLAPRGRHGWIRSPGGRACRELALLDEEAPMTAHDDRARDERPGIDVTGDVDPADIRHDEQPAPTAREIPAGEQRCQETDTATEGMSHNCDMAETREIPADELAEAERQIRHLGTTFPKRHGRTVGVLMAEYDERGRERDAARAEVEELREEYDRLHAKTQDLRLVRDQQAAELKQLRAIKQRASELSQAHGDHVDPRDRRTAEHILGEAR